MLATVPEKKLNFYQGVSKLLFQVLESRITLCIGHLFNAGYVSKFCLAALSGLGLNQRESLCLTTRWYSPSRKSVNLTKNEFHLVLLSK